MHPSDRTITQVTITNTYLSRVFRFMTLGLCITALIAYFSLQSQTFIQSLYSNPLLFLLLLFIEISLALYLSARIATLSAQTASMIFILYSALNGITISPMLFLYTGASIVSTFFICASMFGVMSLYGSSTQRDLTSWGSFLIMGLLGIIIASIVNLFLQSSAVESAITYIGVFIFLGLTAYDVQKLKLLGESMPSNNPTVVQRGVVLGALTLYLDFINLFLFLLRIFGVSARSE